MNNLVHFNMLLLWTRVTLRHVGTVRTQLPGPLKTLSALRGGWIMKRSNHPVSSCGKLVNFWLLTTKSQNIRKKIYQESQGLFIHKEDKLDLYDGVL